MTENDFRKAVRCMRVVPPLFALTMCVHVVLLWCGINLVWSEVLLGLIVFVLLYRVSKCLGYCRLHRIGLMYGYAVFFCCGFQRAVGFGELRHPLHIIFTIVGIAICLGYVVKVAVNYRQWKRQRK